LKYCEKCTWSARQLQFPFQGPNSFGWSLRLLGPAGGNHIHINHSQAESIEQFIEDQAFSLSYDLAPPKPHSHPFPHSKLDRRKTGRLGKIDNFLTGDGWEGEGAKSPNHTTARKSGLL
jgi:hypothetical protein